MAETLHDTSYLNAGLDSIKAANDSGLKNLSLTNANYNSTTHIPSSEPRLIEQLLKAANELYNKLDKDLADIRKVGEGFTTMDNFLEGQSIDLGFQVESAKVNITELSNYAATSLEHLLEKEVPIIEGYNDVFGNEKKNNGNDDGGNSNNGYNGGNEGNNSSTSTHSEKTTETRPENKTEGNTEMLSEPTSETMPEDTTESDTEMLSEPTSETEVQTEVQTEVSTVVTTEVPTTVLEKETKPTGGKNKKPKKGGTNSKPKNSNVETKPKEQANVDTQEIPTEVVKEDPIVIEEPYVEPEPEITIDETPDIIDLDQNIPTEEPVQKNNTGKVVAGVIAGLGLAGGAAAGYGVYKKKKEDKEYEDYGYEEDGGDN